MFRKRTDWVQCAESLGVPFTTYHRDDAPHDVITAANGNYPIILGRTSSGLEVVLNNEQIQACGGSPKSLIAALNSATLT
jgi:hypothetical protein